MRLLLVILILNSMTVFGQSILVAKPDSRKALFVKPNILPGEDYGIVKADSVADKYWLKNKTGDDVTTTTDYSPDNSIKGADILQYFWPKATSDSIKRRHGATAWKKIINGKVVIGWSQDLCRLAWGEPTRIKQTHTLAGSLEQWIYPDSNLYFKNGKLSNIQD